MVYYSVAFSAVAPASVPKEPSEEMFEQVEVKVDVRTSFPETWMWESFEEYVLFKIFGLSLKY